MENFLNRFNSIIKNKFMIYKIIVERLNSSTPKFLY